jgi:hypothetical protein
MTDLQPSFPFVTCREKDNLKNRYACNRADNKVSSR